MHHWYIGGASLPKSEETGSIPVWCTCQIQNYTNSRVKPGGISMVMMFQKK